MQKTTSQARPLADEVMARCQKLASFSEDAGRIHRTFLSAPMRDCHREIRGWLEALGVDVQIDAAGNLRGSYPGMQPDASRLLLGSHLDTVPNAGAYDGVLGVLIAVALLEALDGRKLPFAIEVVGFSEEEGVRFGIPFIGSRALVGRIDENLLNRQDAGGVTVRKAIEVFGLNPAELPLARLRSDTIGYIEFHIEQGPLLDDESRALGVVDAIAGQSRLELSFLGRANHAGTTPMNRRQDALAGAAEWIVEVERLTRSIPDLTATVGAVRATPGATNVIAGQTMASLDVRHRDDRVRGEWVAFLTRRATEIAQRRGLAVEWQATLDENAVAMDPWLVAEVEEAVRKVGCGPRRMTSGAGHDAMILAEKVPAAMVFLRTPGGVSHDPAESVRVQDVASAIDCGLHLLDQIAASAGSRKG